jgi:hypothetical protein
MLALSLLPKTTPSEETVGVWKGVFHFPLTIYKKPLISHYKVVTAID